ncbi:MAG: 1-acyl-sn-glycerol-3-phosphate acyltransferase [Treponema sp.]|jgi:glycerol-3-phosphate O-acyltransferase|nr:1-acyl-sn-glycerol-3-phosphate acyltransferase [Treponema sp.]
MLGTLATVFSEQIKIAVSQSKVSTVITEENVFQEGDANILPLLDEMVESLILPGSGLSGLENLDELLAKAESGKACLLLVEHYSNLDLSIFSLLARKAGGRGKDIGDAVIAIAGMKLNEDNPIVAAFASAYSRIVIYPSRSLHGMPDEIKKVELPRSNAINRAALKALNEKKTKGKLILVFPSGTRYRPWDPETKKGIREIDSYIRSFDYCCFVSLNGEVLHVQKTDMLNDAVSRDIVRVTAGPVMSCGEFREKARAAAEDGEDKKQAVADAIMAELEKMHLAAEEERKKLTGSAGNN